MVAIPDRPKIYHITHTRNLPGIISSSLLWSDAKRIELGLTCQVVGMSEIKRRRLEELDVDCHPGTKVGQYVPFYFCPRSIMLFILHRGNHPDLNYTEGQRPIVHLQADLYQSIQFARENRTLWAFSNANAGTRYTPFFSSEERLGEVNWAAVAATDFRGSLIKDGKQAEFLMFDSFPWELVERVGADMAVQSDVKSIVNSSAHRPPVNVETAWYY